jgi:hypothetical protein
VGKSGSSPLICRASGGGDLDRGSRCGGCGGVGERASGGGVGIRIGLLDLGAQRNFRRLERRRRRLRHSAVSWWGCLVGFPCHCIGSWRPPRRCLKQVSSPGFDLGGFGVVGWSLLLLLYGWLERPGRGALRWRPRGRRPPIGSSSGVGNAMPPCSARGSRGGAPSPARAARRVTDFFRLDLCRSIRIQRAEDLGARLMCG